MKSKIIAYATILNGENDFEVKLQYHLILKMINEFLVNQEIDMEEFVLVVEEVACGQPISVNYARKLLLQTQSFVFDGVEWKYNDELFIGKKKISWEYFLELFTETKVDKVQNSGEDEEKDAIIKGIQWCVYMVQLAQEDSMRGLPAFLRCGEKDSLIGNNVAGTATSDALSLLCSGGEYLKDSNIEMNLLCNSFEFLVKQVLECQYRCEAWDEGGFFPLEDQPEAEHPTVDATCLAIMALCDFYSNRNGLEKDLNLKINIDVSEVGNAVLRGLEFLFRMQQTEGSYGIYKYEQEYLVDINPNYVCETGRAIANENCTRMVISAMGVCKGSGIFDEKERYDLYRKCSECISKAYEYLKNHMAIEQEYSLWAPYFGNNVENYSTADVIVSTARVCRAMIPVWWQKEEERTQIKKFYTDFFIYWKQKEENVHGKIGRYSFKTPGKDKYSVGTYMWQSYPDMIAAFTVLQGYNLFGISLSKEEWRFLERSVNRILDLQHPHGHWNSPEGHPFCAVTLAAIELLREYRKAKGLK